MKIMKISGIINEIKDIFPFTREKQESSPPKDIVEILNSKDEKLPPKKLTVLVYANGDSYDLTSLTPSIIRELEQCGSTDEMNIVAQVSRKNTLLDKFTGDWSGARRFFITQNPKELNFLKQAVNWYIPPFTKDLTSPFIKVEKKETPQKKTLLDYINPIKFIKNTFKPPVVNMNETETFKDFVNWALDRFPAENYVLYYYGSGGELNFLKNLSSDCQNGNNEIIGKIKTLKDKIGKKLDLAVFDIPMAGNIELCDALKDSVKIMTAPQGSVFLGTMPLDLIMTDLKELLKKKDFKAEDAAKLFVYESKNQPKAVRQSMLSALSSIDLSKIDPITEKLHIFSELLKEKIEKNPNLKEHYFHKIKNSQGFYWTNFDSILRDYHDIEHFAELIRDDDVVSDINLKNAAKEVTSAVENAIVARFTSGEEGKNAHGLSIYMPTNYGYSLPKSINVPKDFSPTNNYEKTNIAQKTGWDEFLQSVARDSTFHKMLKKLGVSKDILYKIEGAEFWGWSGILKVIEYFGIMGNLQAGKLAKDGTTRKFWHLSNEIASGLGAAGGAYSAFANARYVYQCYNMKDLLHRKKIMVNGALCSATSAAVTASCIAAMIAEKSDIASKMGKLSVGIPMAAMIFNSLYGIGDIAYTATRKDLEEKPKDLINKVLDTFSGIIGSSIGLVFTTMGIHPALIPLGIINNVTYYTKNLYNFIDMAVKTHLSRENSEKISAEDKIIKIDNTKDVVLK